mgnify:CR=1 FL=1
MVTLGKPADLLVINQGKYGGNGKMEIVCLDLEGVLVQHDTGYHHQRYIFPVCRTAYEKIRISDDILQ